MRLGASSRAASAPWPGVDVPVAAPADPVVSVESLVEVRNRFDDSWTSGFAVTAIRSGDCQIRRVTDESPLPVWFPLEDVRPAPAA